MTRRSAAKLAVYHGYRDLDELVHELPPEAKVLDVGAGRSPLGREVALARPDVEWTNLDPSYKDRRIRREAGKNIPRNLHLVTLDAASLDTRYAPHTFDMAISTWLTPYLDRKRAEAGRIFSQMFEVVKFGGKVSIGPVFEKWDRWDDPASTASIDPTIRIVNEPTHTPDELARQVIAKVLSPPHELVNTK